MGRAQRGSSRHRKKVSTLTREWRRITERNRDDEHQLSAAVARDYYSIAVGAALLASIVPLLVVLIRRVDQLS